MISRIGAARVRMQDIAKEAHVSKALVHYHFTSREDLLASAFIYGQARGRQRVLAEISPLGEGQTRLARLLSFYFQDDAIVLEQWRIWFELCSSAVFRPELREFMENSFQTWVAWIEATIRDGVADGSLPHTVDPSAVTLRLALLVDGLGAAVVRGLINLPTAQEIVKDVSNFELGTSLDASVGRPAPSDAHISATTPTFLRHLVGAMKDAVGELGGFASTEEDIRAVSTVCALLDKIAGPY